MPTRQIRDKGRSFQNCDDHETDDGAKEMMIGVQFRVKEAKYSSDERDESPSFIAKPIDTSQRRPLSKTTSGVLLKLELDDNFDAELLVLAV
ncbi:hypothetical protein CEXT_77241 [Caerostris extrusa]|uniref:Uncharacterized protein n=1 Tax=Caerostris extrusa TaxID=172846 RepID=A0AAV4P3M3_CAEEX|nr:hypothetical protein CEXT_77241 [Caerostris extrusa]